MVRTTIRRLAASAGFMIALALPTMAQAQRDGFPPGQIPGAVGSSVGDSAGQMVRIDRLENRVRDLTGQIEQLQFQMRKMQQQLEAFQKDVDFRFKDSGGASRPQRRGDVREPVAPAAPAEPSAPSEPPARAARRGDVFDPSAQPNAPGAPRQLGSPGNVPTPPLPGGPLTRDMPINPDGGDRIPDPDAPVNLNRQAALPDAPAARPALPGANASPRETYNVAVAALRGRRYGEAEEGFKTFIKRFPDSTLTDDATYNLGITYSSAGRHREAAEQFLKVSTDYKKSKRAPESLYRLGLSLERLGAREQACASYAEVERRYPLAPGNLRTRVERQMTRAKC